MKAIATLAAAAALVTLAGCDRLGGGDANNSANAAAGNAAKDSGGNAAAPAAGGSKDTAAAATPAAGAGGIALDRTFMTGRWTDNEDCGNVIEFTQDGRFIAANGGTGLWNLEGDRLTMSGRATATIRVVPIDRNTITVINEDGSLGRSTRC